LNYLNHKQKKLLKNIDMTTKNCEIDAKQIKIPSSLFKFLKNPKYLIFTPEENDCFFIKGKSNFGLVKYKMRSILKRALFNTNTKQFIAKVSFHSNEKVVFNLKFHNDLFLKTIYNIANYEESVYLIPTYGEEESKGRQKSWSKIENYHEHRKVALQDENSIKISEWLANDVFKKFQPSSMLEIGCGGGRNLIIARKFLENTELTGIDINENALITARENSDGSINFEHLSLYDLEKFDSNSIDIVYTSGVLMHIPHEKVESVISQMHRIAKKAVIHFELHGPSNDFDFHRYPRDYSELYKSLDFNNDFKYEVFEKNKLQSTTTSSYNHCLLVYTK